MPKRSNLMLRILIVASLVVVAAFTGFSLYIDALQRDMLSKSVEEDINSTGKQAAESMASWLNAHVYLIEMAANAVGRMSATDIHSILDNDVLAGKFVSTYVGDEQGAFTTWPRSPMPEGYDPRKRPWYQSAVAANGSVLTEPYLNASNGELIVSAAVPIKRDGKLFGVTASDFSLNSLVTMVNSIDLGGKGFAFLVNKSGQILLHPDATLITKTLSDAFPHETPTVTRGLMHTTYAGKPVLVSFVPVMGLPSAEWYLGFTIDSDLAYAGIQQFRIASTIATVLAVIGMIGFLAIVLSHLVVRPVRRMTFAMGQLAAGVVIEEIPGERRKDEIGEMAAAVAVFRDNAIDRLRLEKEAEASRSTSETERFERENAKRKEAADTQFAVDGLATGLERLANGDLTYRVDTPFVDHLDRLRANYNTAASTLQHALVSMGQNVQSIDSGANEIRKAADDLSRRTEQQAASVEETAAALEEITASISTATCRAQEAGQLVRHTKECAEKSGEVMKHAVEAMAAIEMSSAEIGSIIGVIDEIAFQTNLLALNAGVEAARAGEAGKGFAVVAQEVRELAQRSANAAKEIKSLIDRSRNQVHEGAALVGQTGLALSEIVSEIQEITRHVSSIVEVAHEQSSGLQQINAAVNQIDQGTQENAAMVEQSTAACHSLASEISVLNRLISQFRLSGGAVRLPSAQALPSAEADSHATLSPAHALGRRIANAFAGL